MESTVLTVLSASVFAFCALVLVTQQERRRGRRFFAAPARAWLDDKADRLESTTSRSLDHFVKYIVQLNWYYSIHSVLRTFLRMIVVTYTYVEGVFERNRARTKELRREKRELHTMSHLQQMAQHKVDTALTPAEQRKLRKKELEGK